jgi:prolyl-tRNA editing enzyme YbaK/EbsC (Cys-tRNA(Pro) deacylase)
MLSSMDKQTSDAEWAAEALAAMLERIAKALALEYEAAAVRLRKWAA